MAKVARPRAHRTSNAVHGVDLRRLAVILGFVLGLLAAGCLPPSATPADKGHAAVDHDWQATALPAAAWRQASLQAETPDALLPSPAALPAVAPTDLALGFWPTPGAARHRAVVPPVRGPPVVVA